MAIWLAYPHSVGTAALSCPSERPRFLYIPAAPRQNKINRQAQKRVKFSVCESSCVEHIHTHNAQHGIHKAQSTKHAADSTATHTHTHTHRLPRLTSSNTHTHTGETTSQHSRSPPQEQQRRRRRRQRQEPHNDTLSDPPVKNLVLHCHPLSQSLTQSTGILYNFILPFLHHQLVRTNLAPPLSLPA